ncbi:cucumber peeling cupredoxin-like protein, partial [Tanacetum coccineum]
AQTRHVVGDSIGWAVPSNGAAAYTSWATGKTFRVGDTLVFNFTTNAHNVLEVSQSAYGPCTLANPITTVTNGPANITLKTVGNHYYVCGVGPHCQLGQKVMVDVVGASGSTPPAATSPAPSGSTPSNPNATTSPPSPSPSPSSASTLMAVVPVAFLAAALALVF